MVRSLILLLSLIPLACYAAPKVTGERQKLIDFALELRGTPYLYAGKTPTGFDCSGYVRYTFNNAVDIQLPASSQDIYDSVDIIEEKEREPGDLMFFKTTSSGKISHVGIYLGLYHGEGKFNKKRLFIHAASDGPETGVIISAIDENYWKSHLAGWGRVLPPSK